jgi:hypothetical protein
MAKTKRHDEFRYSEFSIDACRFLGNSSDYAAMVTLQAVPDDQQFTRQMAQYVRQELDHLRTAVVRFCLVGSVRRVETPGI